MGWLAVAVIADAALVAAVVTASALIADWLVGRLWRWEG